MFRLLKISALLLTLPAIKLGSEFQKRIFLKKIKKEPIHDIIIIMIVMNI